MALNFITGKTDLIIKSDNSSGLINELSKNNIPIKKITTKKGKIHISVSFIKLKLIKKICINKHYEIESVNSTGFFPKICKYRFRYGLMAGILAAITIIFILSNIVLKIEIVGGNSDLDNEIKALLKQQNIDIGSFIPSIDFSKSESYMMLNSKNFAWITLRNNGAVLVVDVLEKTKEPEMTKTRPVTNLVASHDAVITDVNVYIGKLMKVVGKKVKKGDVLVSGKYRAKAVDESKKDEAKLMLCHCKGEIMADYDESITFEQDFKDEQKIIIEDDKTRKYLTVFDLEIPISIGKKVEGNYIMTDSRSNFSFLGFKLPVGISKKSYDKYYFENIKLSKKEAKEKILNKIKIYETNFLKDKKILNKELKTKETKKGLSITVKYKLNGNIAMEKELLTK